jgi:hypothetical protein
MSSVNVGRWPWLRASAVLSGRFAGFAVLLAIAAGPILAQSESEVVGPTLRASESSQKGRRPGADRKDHVVAGQNSAGSAALRCATAVFCEERVREGDVEWKPALATTGGESSAADNGFPTEIVLAAAVSSVDGANGSGAKKAVIWVVVMAALIGIGFLIAESAT